MIRLPFRRGGEKAKSKDFLESITSISIRIKELEERLEESLRRLKERDKELFDKTVRAKMDGDDARAIIYAQEISDIRKMIKIVCTAQLALEKVRIKLETVHELQNFSTVLLPMIKVLDELKSKVKNVVPEVAIAFDALASNVNSLAIETGIISEKSINPTVIDEEARKVLEDAQKQAEAKMREILPEFPHPPTYIEDNKRRTKIEISAKRLTEQELLEYLKSTGGILDVDHVTRIYNVDKDTVFELLNRLVEKKLVIIE